MTTLRQARAAVTAALSAAMSSQTTVYGYEARPGGLSTPTAVTVATAGIADTDWQLVVRVYVTTRTGEFAAAQDTLDTLMLSADTALGDVPIPRTTWQVQFVDELECLVASTVVPYPRDDF